MQTTLKKQTKKTVDKKVGDMTVKGLKELPHPQNLWVSTGTGKLPRVMIHGCLQAIE